MDSATFPCSPGAHGTRAGMTFHKQHLFLQATPAVGATGEGATVATKSLL